ncbi:hypothetical protein C0991_012266 [Blastosporella zonata]|nr:hypothetical protein C0991_012266 [Blastosporella zonata]
MDLMLNSVYVERPRISEEEIDDRSKGDWVAKTLAVLQTTYFLVQCITRVVRKLPISELEIVTFAYTILNIYVYAMWWKKPQNVDCPFPIYEKRRSELRQVIYERSVRAQRQKSENSGGSDTTGDDRASWPWYWRWIAGFGRGMLTVLKPSFFLFKAWASPEEDRGIEATIIPPLYSYGLKQSFSARDLCYSALMASIFGGIHCLSWFFPLNFPTRAEQMIWRVCCVTVTAVPPILLPCVLIVNLYEKDPSLFLHDMSYASSSSSAPRYTLKRRISVANSSDTEPSATPPPKKRSRRERSGLAPIPDCDLDELLRRRVFDPKDDTVFNDLRNMKRLKRDQDVLCVAHDIIDNIKSHVKEEIREEGRKTLEVELYLKWLEGFDFVLNGIEAVLNAKVPGTRRRVAGVGRVLFSLLFHLAETFIDEVNAHQDGWSFRHPAGPVEPDPLIMTLAEESNHSSLDKRSEEAIRDAEQLFQRYDRIMVLALRRYKSECNKKLMAPAIDRKEESLSRGCCLLSEQTGYGGTDDMGFNLLVDTREAMMEWKSEGQSTASPR